MPRHVRRLAAAAAVGLVVASGTAACKGQTLNTDPAKWSNRTLAAELVIAGAQMSNLSDAAKWADSGVGGILLLGNPPKDLGNQLAVVHSMGTVPPLIACDVEGGASFLSPAIGSLPTTEQLGTSYSTSQIQSLVAEKGRRMKALHVDVDFSPVADLRVPGRFMATYHRAFSSDPAVVGRDVVAWAKGMRSARVLPVVKHWPGHGSADNTHPVPGITPPLAVMEARDMRPFNTAFQSGVSAVMVGHLTVPGLTEPNRPATLSPAAYRYLRPKVGPNGLVITDLMNMGAATTAMKLDTNTAALHALEAGADAVIVLTDPYVTINQIQHAIDTGQLPRAQAIASARRMLAAKRLIN